MNIGFDLTTQNEALELINYFHQYINMYQDEFGIPSNIQQLIEYHNKDKLCIAFDIEGANILDGKLDMVATFYSLGVKQIAFSYNNHNAAGGGYFDTTDTWACSETELRIEFTVRLISIDKERDV